MTTADSPNGNRDSDDARWRLDDDRPFELGSIDWSDDEQRPLVQPGTSRAMDLSLRWAKEPDPSTSVDDVEPALAESVDDVDLSMLEELLEQPVPDAPEFVPHREVYADPEPTPPVALVAVEPAPEPEQDRDAPEPAAGPEEPAVAFPDDDHDAQVAYSDWEAWRDSLTGRLTRTVDALRRFSEWADRTGLRTVDTTALAQSAEELEASVQRVAGRPGVRGKQEGRP